jgi:type IV secretion system protein VirB8
MTALKSERPLTYDEAVTKHFLAQYVRAREGWLAPAAEANFRQVSIMSTPAEQQRWADAFRPANPQSPQVVYGPAAEALVAIRAVSFVSDGVANVRFHRTVRRGPQLEESDWIATVAFTYTKAPMAEADRLRNPLGFQVTSYRADPEAVR